MKKHLIYSLIVVFLFFWLSPACAQDHVNLLLMIPPIIAATHIVNTPVLWKGLEWQRSGDGNKYIWEEAKKYCEDFELGGHSDWHLPTKDELKSLVYCSNGVIILNDFPRDPWNCAYSEEDFVSPTIDDSFYSFPDAYWSSTPKSTDKAWLVNFRRGGCGTHIRSAVHYVRCVR